MKTRYEAIYEQTSHGIYLLMVRDDGDGYKNVVRDFKARYFKTMVGAQKAADKYLEGKNK